MKNSLKYRNLNRTKQWDTEQRKEKNDRSLPMNKIHTHTPTLQRSATQQQQPRWRTQKKYTFFTVISTLSTPLCSMLFRSALGCHSTCERERDQISKPNRNQTNEMNKTKADCSTLKLFHARANEHTQQKICCFTMGELGTRVRCLPALIRLCAAVPLLLLPLSIATILANIDRLCYSTTPFTPAKLSTLLTQPCATVPYAEVIPNPWMHVVDGYLILV